MPESDKFCRKCGTVQETLSRGVPAKIVQQQLGHASVTTTLNIYTHAIADSHRQAIVDLEQVLFPSCSQVGSVPGQDVTVTH